MKPHENRHPISSLMVQTSLDTFFRGHSAPFLSLIERKFCKKCKNSSLQSILGKIESPHYLSDRLEVYRRFVLVRRGKVKWFNESKGYGFLEQENGSDVFVHHTAIQGDGFRTLKEGETVEFECENSQKGLKATAVVRL